MKGLKGYLLLLTAFAFVLGVGAPKLNANAQTTNLISNGNFENSDADWYELGPANVTSVAYPGADNTSNSLKIGNGEGGMGQMVSASGNSTYVLEGYGKVSGNGEIGYLGVDCMNANGVKIGGGKFEVTFTTTSFTKKTLEFTTVDGTAYIQVYTYKNYSNASVYLDEIVLSAFSEESALENEGFESGKSNWYELGPAYVTNIVPGGTGTTGNALRVGTGEGGMGQRVSALANTSYVLSGVGKVSGNETGYLGVDCMNANGVKIPGGKFEITFTNDYYLNKYLTFTTVPGTAYIQVYTYKNPGSGYVYFDSIYLSNGSGNGGGNNSRHEVNAAKYR